MFNAICRLGAEGKNSLLSNSCSPVTPIWLYSMYLIYTNCIYTHMSHIPYLELCFNSWYGYKLPVNDIFLRVQAFFTGWQLLSQYLVWPQRQSVAIVSNSILILNGIQGSWLKNCYCNWKWGLFFSEGDQQRDLDQNKAHVLKMFEHIGNSFFPSSLFCSHTSLKPRVCIYVQGGFFNWPPLNLLSVGR